MNLPDALKKYQPIIESSKQDYIKVEISKENKDIPITSSKIGGNPYLPIEMDYPVDKAGNPMALLAQLNFSEIPQLPDYPSKGLLQFYISMDDLYGLNFDNQTVQEGFKVIYHPKLNYPDLHSDFSFLDDYLKKEEIYPIVTGEYKLGFRKDVCYVSVSDFNFQAYFGSNGLEFFEQFEDTEEDMWEAYDGLFSSSGHRIGGYAFFTQEDPRNWKKQLRTYNKLLFQLDSEGEFLMWGDVGVGNFFIKEEDLKKLNFSDILYNWDCG
ncbi:YwqG family protein [Flammeovirgaceae bacterium SG7u.111]|nr:YwqG family protein [Flammeovirgaceae bacterium SG7u.132]WPO37162.1 YwqG family protein [Flammeovirgaceae bacterium SG7u.111]